MQKFLKGAFTTAAILAFAAPAAAQFGGPPSPPNTGIPVYARLVGGLGSGNFTGVIDPPKAQFCYILNVSGAGGAGAATVSSDSGAVLTLKAPDGGTSGGCQPITAEVAEAVLANPSGYYVTVGSLQGRLAK